MVAFPILTLGLLIWQGWAKPTSSQNAVVTNSPSLRTHTVASNSTEAASAQLLDQLARFALKVTINRLASNSASQDLRGCTMANLQVRRDWRAISPTMKKAYIRSVLCLQKLPARTPSNVAKGAKTRYDDFLATHIAMSVSIHRSGTFLGWHRYFIYEFEQALRNECGYDGDFPYWNWAADANDMEKSQVFDGSDTSLSGNGAYIPNQPDIKLNLGTYGAIDMPAGTGGGCVTSGPFKDYKVNMGPSILAMPGGNLSGMSNPLDYNPRCMKRSLTPVILQKYANYTSIVQLILNNHDVGDFQTMMQGVPESGSLGVHGGGHYAMGGDPGRDMDASPGDPGFWHHHGMIDRVWWIWQNLDAKAREYAISGTNTFMNQPPSPNTTLDTVITLRYANGDPIAMRDLMSTTAGRFCYVYL